MDTDLIFVYIIIFLFYWSLSGILILLTSYYFGYIKIKLPKKKIYNTKKEPIYNLELSGINDRYFVEKWYMDYQIHEPLTFLISIIPIPIRLYKYGYIRDPMVFYIVTPYNIPWKDDINRINDINYIKDINLGEFYEEKLDESTKKYQLSLEEDNLKRSIIDNLNKEFNENIIW